MAREPQNSNKADKKSGASARDARLKAALRENLRLRKAQARGRADVAPRSGEPESAPSDKKNG